MRNQYVGNNLDYLDKEIGARKYWDKKMGVRTLRLVKELRKGD